MADVDTQTKDRSAEESRESSARRHRGWVRAVPDRDMDPRLWSDAELKNSLQLAIWAAETKGAARLRLTIPLARAIASRLHDESYEHARAHQQQEGSDAGKE